MTLRLLIILTALAGCMPGPSGGGDPLATPYTIGERDPIGDGDEARPSRVWWRLPAAGERTEDGAVECVALLLDELRCWGDGVPTDRRWAGWIGCLSPSAPEGTPGLYDARGDYYIVQDGQVVTIGRTERSPDHVAYTVRVQCDRHGLTTRYGWRGWVSDEARLSLLEQCWDPDTGAAAWCGDLMP
jgi:hypothetical protein